jgi:hypothetical protein
MIGNQGFHVVTEKDQSVTAVADVIQLIHQIGLLYEILHGILSPASYAR